MAKKTVPFQGTKEQEEKLLEMIRTQKNEKGALMPVMQQAQDIYGYLPIEVQKIISDEMQIPMEKNLWCCNLLFSVCAATKRKISDFRMSGNCLLCKGFRRDLRKTSGNIEDQGRRMYSGRKIFSGSLSLRRRLRPCSGYDDQR